ncbi:phosphate ABC transporter substrate-binding protein (plasmid) [Burkholderia cenocepacia]|uniref:phosphate ABC transporter substrate-binding protein PstS n=2 Tax=Burkholderia cenocepacia TaxID=95486 RepID=UPI00073A6FEC|nr:phosphate ABC transporter substrate-binding protein PstS [Burkholderia cenocepacia]ALV61661.1 phosphate ABC transporter substrate-binding protein [Burkholderia cenocepacia]
MKLKAIPVLMLAMLSSSLVHAVDITGAGSTFAAPIYAKWADAYHKSGGGKINYQGIGSSGGIKQIQAKTVDFAGSDAPLKDVELTKDGLFQFPTVVGGVVPAINVPGIKAGEITLSGPVLGDIYLGKIKKWNDPAIVALNPKVKLPDLDIAVVRRADGSGTSFIWTNYLSKVNPEWKSKVGEGTTVAWPTGSGGKGNDGVAAFVQRLPGTIGYVEWAYAKQNHMIYTAMKNESGAVVEPTTETFKAAAAGADWKKSFYQILTNEPGKDAWPVVGATFVLLHTVQDKPEQAKETLKFFEWSFKNGTSAADSLDYISLPQSVVSEIENQWKVRVKDATGKSDVSGISCAEVG